MTIGERIQKRRQEMGVSRKWVSERSGVSCGTIKYIENGITTRPRDRNLEKIASVLDISISDFDADRQERKKKKREYNPRYREAREETWRTLERAADELGIKAETLERIEAGKVCPTELQLIYMALLYGKTVGWLVGIDEVLYTGRRCRIGAPCAAGKRIDYCCADCPERAGCEDRCLNDPEKCGQVKEGGDGECVTVKFSR